MASNAFMDRINQVCEQSYSMASAIANEMGCVNESLLAAKRVLCYNPNSETVLSLFPQYRGLINRLTQIVEENGKKLKNEPHNGNLWSSLGFCYLLLGDFPNSFAAFAHNIESSLLSNDFPSLYSIGVVLGHFKYWGSCHSHMTKALNITQDIKFSADIRFRLGIVCRNMERYEDSLEFFKSVIKTCPRGLIKHDIDLQIAYTLQRMGRIENAISIYLDIMKEYSDNSNVTTQFAISLVTHCNEMKPEKSQQMMRQILQYHKDPNILMLSARLAMKTEDLKSAYEQYNACINICSAYQYFWCGLGILYYKNQQFDDASTAFQRALSIKNDNPDAIYFLGQISEIRNDHVGAIQLYKTGAQKFPTYTLFNERLNAMNLKHNPHNPMMAPKKDINELNDEFYITPPSQAFAQSYISAVPFLPSECFTFQEFVSTVPDLSTLPKSLFNF